MSRICLAGISLLLCEGRLLLGGTIMRDLNNKKKERKKICKKKKEEEEEKEVD